ncbi:hypothetical protein [Sodalinema gerasimenkoae]|uniref:hypothetical protein n=1 Tax=Sodalinema gerasimenkoae TaxID=2862348 RepID=UPI003CCDF52C
MAWRLLGGVPSKEKLGANVSERPDGLEITGGGPLKGADLESYDDHRVAMSLAIAALLAQS